MFSLFARQHEALDSIGPCGSPFTGASLTVRALSELTQVLSDAPMEGLLFNLVLHCQLSDASVSRFVNMKLLTASSGPDGSPFTGALLTALVSWFTSENVLHVQEFWHSMMQRSHTTCRPLAVLPVPEVCTLPSFASLVYR